MLYVLLHTGVPERENLSQNSIPYCSTIWGTAFDPFTLQKEVLYRLECVLLRFSSDEAAIARRLINLGQSCQLNQFEMLKPILNEDGKLYGYQHILTVSGQTATLIESLEIMVYNNYKGPVIFVELFRGLLSDVYTDIPGKVLLHQVITGEEAEWEDPENIDNKKLLEALKAQHQVRGISTATQWFITDDSCYQCCRQITGRIFELVQVCSVKDGYAVAHAVINVDDYSIDDWETYLAGYGHQDIREFIEDYNCELNLRILAEYIFETDWIKYIGEKKYSSSKEAAKVVDTLVDCDLALENHEVKE